MIGGADERPLVAGVDGEDPVFFGEEEVVGDFELAVAGLVRGAAARVASVAGAVLEDAGC